MALQVTRTNSNGLDVSYWRVKSFSVNYEDSWKAPTKLTGAAADAWATGQLCTFFIEGYHNSGYRAVNAGVESHRYTLTGSDYTSIVNTTSGDLRPGIYDYLKSNDVTYQGASKLTTGFFHSATDV